MPITLRDARQADSSFLTEMLVEAVNWNRASTRPRVELLADTRVTRYVAGWQRPSDLGSLAVDEKGVAVGACWIRLFGASAPGYGFVGTGVPELTLGVSPVWRAQGIGRDLLRRVIGQARSAGYARLSLSVSRGNFAARLYRSEGFSLYEAQETADVMVRTLR